MFCQWMILIAVMGQTTQPTAPASAAVQPVKNPTNVTVARTATQPVTADTTRTRRPKAPARGTATTRPAASQDDNLSAIQQKMVNRIDAQQPEFPDIGKLSGNPVEIEVTSDGSLVLYGDEEDLAILEAFIEVMEKQPGIRPEFEIFKLEAGQASDLATKIEQFWNAAKQPPAGKLRPEDRITIIPEARANILMVAASKDNMEEIKEIIKALDQPSLAPGKAVFHSHQLKYIKAAEAEQVVKEIVESLQKQRNAPTELFSVKAISRTNMLLITAPEADLEVIKNLIDKIDVEPTAETWGVVKMAVYPLEKADADDLAKVLTEMLQMESDAAKAITTQIRRLQVVLKAPDGREKALSDLDLEKPIKVMAESGTNSLIVQSVESNLGPIREIIRLLDSVPVAEEMLVNIFPLEHADAETVLKLLQEMFDRGKRLPDQPGREGKVPDRIPQGLQGRALVYNISMSADKRTNTLVVAGQAEQLLIITQVIKAMDVEESANKFPPRMITLQHADVRRIAEVAKELATHRKEMAEKYGELAAQRESIVVIPDVRTNSLIVVAKDDNYEEIANLARKLDTADEEWLGQIRIINMPEHMTAADIADKLDKLWARRTQLRKDSELPPDEPVIVTDSRSNSLVIASNPEDFEAMARLIKELQEQRISPMADIRPIILKHNDASKVGEVVSKLFEERLKQSKAKDEEELPSERVAIVGDPLTNTLLVASSKSNFEEILKLVEKLDVPPDVEGIIKTFYIKNADVTKAAEMIEKMFDEGIYRGSSGDRELPESLTKVAIVPDMRSSALIVSASPQNFAIIESLLKEIDRLDTPVFPTDAWFFHLEHADVVSVADMLDQLFEGMRKTLKDEQDQLEITAIPDIRSNVLIVAGTRYAIKRAKELVPKLDEAPGEPTSVTQVYMLNEASAGVLEEVMTKLFENRSQGQQDKRTPITIIADEGSNALIISASKRDHLDVDDLLKKLDRKSSLAQQMEIIPLAEAKAVQLADTLEELLKQQQADKSEAFAITPEERTNSLVVWAPADMMLNIKSIVNKLDNSKPKTEMGLKVFKLLNQKAEELSKLLEEFFQKAGAGDKNDARQLIIKFAQVDPKTGKPMIDPATGAEMLKSLVHQDITITPDKTTNSLVVMAPETSIDMMQMLIEMLDSVEPVIAQIRSFPLHNADATEMKNLLDELFQTKGKGGDEERRRLIFGEAGLGPGGFGGAALDLAFSVDVRTNALIAAGSEAYLKIVERLVYQLDYQEIEDRIVRVVRLRNARANEVSETMKAYFEEESKLLQAAAEGEALTRQLQRQVTITDQVREEGDSNLLLMSYSPRMESKIVEMLNKLDAPIPQVMIQVLMAEVTLNDNLEMGMEFALQDLLFSEKAVVGSNGTLHGDNFDYIFGTDIGAGGTGGVGGISFSVTGEDFNFLFRALQTEGRVEVLSRPSIMVQDGQEANITVGEKVPTIQDVTVSGAGIIVPSVSYVDVGVILDVTPIINPDGYVNMKIKPEISAIGTSQVTVASGVTLPTFTERSAETTVTVKDGETIIIGGLITNRENSSENKAPIVGDIPVLGNLFRATTKTTTKTELLIVLTPHVILEATDAYNLSIQMRDQTGFSENIRTSPLMENLQVSKDEDHLGPADADQPLGPSKDQSEQPEEMGPELDEFGPPISSIEIGPERNTVAVRY